jgi:hypothetical protein
VIALPIEQVWKALREFDFPSKLISTVTGCELAEGSATSVGAGASPSSSFDSPQSFFLFIIVMSSFSFDPFRTGLNDFSTTSRFFFGSDLFLNFPPSMNYAPKPRKLDFPCNLISHLDCVFWILMPSCL